MALVESNMLPLGYRAPEFNLQDVVSNEWISPNNFQTKKGWVLMFICAHCPYVKHIEAHIARIARKYQGLNIGFVAISSNDAQTYPQDAPEGLKKQAKNNEFPFPYLYDPTQEVAKAYQAACTPEFFLFDGKEKLIYRGRFDESSPGNGKHITGSDLSRAIERHLKGEPILENQFPSIGCSIKWK